MSDRPICCPACGAQRSDLQRYSETVKTVRHLWSETDRDWTIYEDPGLPETPTGSPWWGCAECGHHWE